VYLLPRFVLAGTVDAYMRGMPRQVDRDEVRRLAGDGAHVVDALSERAYRELHIAGALSRPLGELDRKAADELSRDGLPIVVYCNDYT
jgi:rhodanese-related sulfurtransferase